MAGFSGYDIYADKDTDANIDTYYLTELKMNKIKAIICIHF